MLHSRDPKLLFSIALEAADSSLKVTFTLLPLSDMIRPKTAGCLQKQMRVNSSTQGRSGVCAALEVNQQPVGPSVNAGAEHFIRKRCSDFLCGAPAATAPLLV